MQQKHYDLTDHFTSFFTDKNHPNRLRHHRHSFQVPVLVMEVCIIRRTAIASNVRRYLSTNTRSTIN